MAIIHLTSIINAAIERVFDLNRSIDLHIISTEESAEKAISGVTEGLIGPGQEVTWQAYHLFKERRFTSKITAFQKPCYFKDEMQEGDFKNFSHEHFYEEKEGGTEMSDKVILEAPFAALGKLVMAIYLKNYITRLLVALNKVIKHYAETSKWKNILKNNNGQEVA